MRGESSPTNFVLMSTQRSGSTWVLDMLDSHPAITCYDALFLPEGTGKPFAGAAGKQYFADYVRARDPLVPTIAAPVLGWQFLNHLYTTDEPMEAIGFKFMYSQFKPYPWLLAYLRLRGLRVVHLVRENKLDHVLARISARVRGKYHSRAGEALEMPKLHVDPQDLVRQIEHEERKVRRARAILAALRLERIEVAYEDLVADPKRFDGILAFLGVDPAGYELQSVFQKWARGSYEDRIENYDAVRSALERTRYAPLLRAAGRRPQLASSIT
jgi:LPS sulfotransferase NodH